MQPNNLPPEGWVLKMEHDHPRKDEVVKVYEEVCGRDIEGVDNFYNNAAYSFKLDPFPSHLPRLSMDDFLARTVDYKGEVKVGYMVEASDTADFYGNVVGELLFVLPEKYGKSQKYLIGLDVLDCEFFNHIRPIQHLTYTLAEARAELEKLKERPVKIEG